MLLLLLLLLSPPGSISSFLDQALNDLVSSVAVCSLQLCFPQIAPAGPGRRGGTSVFASGISIYSL
ncbi:hypothetical protein E2C01_089801 [Portunus trituberculatus]|uniref:Secreted protein n=1 Tax=Portunus trituberculatus TaxID=210409 RepID=A0A5B7JQL8_PORTR|nr:hypothetical protein [Portunus trituberculatus]